MKELEHNVDQYSIVLEQVKELRTVELRQSILNDISGFFSELRKVISQIEAEKIKEVHDIFKSLRFDEIDDLDEFLDLQATGRKALATVKQRFKNLAFASIYNYRISYEGISDHINEVTAGLKTTNDLYRTR